MPTGRVDHSLISSVDWMPTLARLTGSSIPAGTVQRGHDISDILFGRQNNVLARPADKPLLWRGNGAPPPCWNRAPGLAVRRDEVKLLFNPDLSRVELYNLSLSLLGAHTGAFFESQNIKGGNDQLVQELQDIALAWHNSIPPERPGATNTSMSVTGCEAFPFPGL